MGSVPNVQIAITASDLTGPSFAAAQARVQGFQTASVGSMRESLGAARLLSHELDLGLNRELLRAVAGSQLLQGALALAMPVGLAIGFAAAAYKVWENLSGAKQAAEDLASRVKLAETFTEIAKQVAKIQEGIREIGMTSQQIAVSAMTEAQFRLVSAQLSVMQQRSMAASLDSAHAKKFPGGEALLPDQSMADALRSSADKQGVQLALLQAKLDEAIAKMGKSFLDLSEKSAEEAQRVRNAWIEAMDAAAKSSDALLHKGEPAEDTRLRALDAQVSAWDKIRQSHEGINALANEYVEKLQKEVDLTKAQEAADIANSLRASGRKGFGDLVSGNSTMPTFTGSKAGMDLYKVQTDMNASWAAARDIIDSLETPLQNYNHQLDAMNELLMQGKISVAQFDAAAENAAKNLEKSPYAKFYKELGQDIARTIAEAATFQESWSRAFKRLLIDVEMLIIKMVVFKELSKLFGGSKTFLGKLFGDLAGKAEGGPVSGGMSYLVGERGPELFTPGASGAITPNGALRGGGVTYNIDARGADVGVEQRIHAAIAASERRAVQRAVATKNDWDARR